MGMDYTTYIGPYIEVDNPPADTMVDIQACTNPKCSLYGDETTSKFCSECGIKVGTHSKQITRPINFYVMDETNGRLAEAYLEVNGKNFYYPNVKTPFQKWDYDPISEVFWRELEDRDLRGDILAFKLKFHNDVKKIEERFGTKAIKLHYGVLSYAH
jgi:hypothetical protein